MHKDIRVKHHPILDICGSYSKLPLNSTIRKDIEEVDGILLNTTNRL